MIAVLGLVVGVVAGLLVRPEVPAVVEPYLPIAVVAALDAVFGGLRAMLDGIFDDKVFVVSFLSNVVVAALIVFLGDKLGVGVAAVHRCGGRPRHPDLLQRRGDPPARLPGVRPMSNDDDDDERPRAGCAAELPDEVPARGAREADAGRRGAGRARADRPAAAGGGAVAAAGDPGPTHRRRCCCSASGFGLAIQVRSNSDSGSALRGARQEDLVRILDELGRPTQRLEDEKQGLENQRTELENSSNQAEEARKQTVEKEQQLGILAGTVAAQGPGITLTITDPKGRCEADMLLDTLQELRAAGRRGDPGQRGAGRREHVLRGRAAAGCGSTGTRSTQPYVSR